MSYTYYDPFPHVITLDQKKISNPAHQPLVIGEAKSHYMPFSIDGHIVDGVDISNMTFSVCWFNNMSKKMAETECINKEVSDDGMIHFGWVVPKDALDAPGTLYFYVKVSDGEWIWKSLETNKDIVATNTDKAAAGGGYVPVAGSTVDDRLKALERGGVDLPTKEELLEVVNQYFAENPVTGVTPEMIANAVESYLTEHPVQGGHTDAQINQLIQAYLTAHPVVGEKGDKGDSYTITQSDYTAIANVVLGLIPNGNEVLYGN